MKNYIKRDYWAELVIVAVAAFTIGLVVGVKF